MRAISKEEAERLRHLYRVIRTKNNWLLTTEKQDLHFRVLMKNKLRNRLNSGKGIMANDY